MSFKESYSFYKSFVYPCLALHTLFQFLDNNFYFQSLKTSIIFSITRHYSHLIPQLEERRHPVFLGLSQGWDKYMYPIIMGHLNYFGSSIRGATSSGFFRTVTGMGQISHYCTRFARFGFPPELFTIILLPGQHPN